MGRFIHFVKETLVIAFAQIETHPQGKVSAMLYCFSG